MTTECSGSAFLNGAHGPSLITGQPMSLSITRAVLTEDIRHLDTVRCPHPFYNWD
jgi:hypothetical protein